MKNLIKRRCDVIGHDELRLWRLVLNGGVSR